MVSYETGHSYAVAKAETIGPRSTELLQLLQEFDSESTPSLP
jgi:hypothetical protein